MFDVHRIPTVGNPKAVSLGLTLTSIQLEGELHEDLFLSRG